MENEPCPHYAWWVDYKGVWELKQAANLYLGFNPDKGGTFYMVDDFLAKYDRGLILTDSDTVWSVEALKNPQSSVEWGDVFDKNGNHKTSLEDFVKDRLRVGEINPIIDNNDLPPGIYFKPTEIVSFFQKHLLNKPPRGLLRALGLNTSAASKSFAAPKNETAHEAAYKAYHDEQVALYLAGKAQKPWMSQDKEESVVSVQMEYGFNRSKFREARKTVLAPYPGFGKTNLSANDHERLKAYISSQKKVA